jgi:uncharacterized membrane protein YdjX (TVP38/TMEM64 family)
MGLEKMKLKSNITQACISLLILFLFIMIIDKYNLFDRMNLNGIIEYVSSKGNFSEVTFIFLFAIKPVLLIVPSSIFSIASGMLFGPIKGFILSMIGFAASGTTAFYLSRLLGKSYVDKLVKGKLLKLDEGIEHNGFKVIFMIRFPPIFPYDIVSITAGITRVKYSKFILGSVLGVIPETLCYAFIGKSLTSSSTFSVVLPFLFMILILIVTLFIYKKSKEKF